MSKKRTPADTWKALTRQADRDEAARLDALGDAELDREVAAAGMDPAAQRAKAEALRKVLLGAVENTDDRPSIAGAAVSLREPTPKGRSRRPRWVVELALVAAVGAAGAAVAVGVSGIINRDTDAGVTLDAGSAEDVRAAALRACDGKQWDACQALLDRAAALDPKGEDDLRVKAARRALAAAKAPAPGTAATPSGPAAREDESAPPPLKPLEK